MGLGEENAVAVLNKVIRRSLIELGVGRVKFEQRLEGVQGVSWADMLDTAIQAEGWPYRGFKARACLTILKNSQAARVTG